jgi:hypothetical protein
VLGEAMSVATGLPWLGRRVAPGRVVYVYAEGGDALGLRLGAWRAANDWPEEVTRAHFLTEPVSLSKARHIEALIREMDSLPDAPSLVVFDTLARCAPGADENAAKDMGLIIDAAGEIHRATGAAIQFVHHPTKDGMSERGSSALRAACDVIWSVRARGMAVEAKCEKLKDGAPPPAIRALVEVVGSAVALSPNASVAAIPAAAGMTDGETDALRILLKLEEAQRRPVRATDWIRGGLSQGSHGKFRRKLLAKGLIESVTIGAHSLYTLTDAGRNAVGVRYPDTIRTVSDHAGQ